MALVRQGDKPEREKHAIIPVHGEVGRYMVNSRSAAKKGRDEVYLVDVLDEHVTVAHGKIIGTCGCKGFQVRGTCSHLVDAKEYHEKVAVIDQATELGFDNLNATSA